MIKLIIKHKGAKKKKEKQCRKVKYRRGTSEAHLICIQDQFLWRNIKSSKNTLVNRERKRKVLYKWKKMMVNILILYMHSMSETITVLLHEKPTFDANSLNVQWMTSVRLCIEDRCHRSAITSTAASQVPGYCPEILHHRIVWKYCLTHQKETWTACVQGLRNN